MYFANVILFALLNQFLITDVIVVLVCFNNNNKKDSVLRYYRIYILFWEDMQATRRFIFFHTDAAV